MRRALLLSVPFALVGCSDTTPDNLNDAMIANEAAKLEATANASVADQIKSLETEANAARKTPASEDVNETANSATP